MSLFAATGTEPVYRSERAELWLGDAREVLPRRETESVDLVVTDPPYGIEYVSGRRVDTEARAIAHDGANEADRDVVRTVLAECVRLVGQHRHLYVFGPPDALDGLKVAELVTIVWDKGGPGMGDLSATWSPSHELITFAVSKHRHAGETGKGTLAARLRRGTVLRVNRKTGRVAARHHATEKPVGLLRQLIESSSHVDDLVLDPFAGSGSTGVAALLTGRRTLLVEKDPAYAAIAADRLRAADALADQLDALS